MVNELRELMRDASDHPPHDDDDLAGVLRHGRRRVRTRRAGVVGGTALAAGAITVASMSWFNPTPADLAAAGVPAVSGPSVRLTDARPAVEGQDYRELASYTNDDLDADNGQYLDGVTTDGLVLFRDGPRSDQLYPRFALMDPATGDKDWLPRLRVGQSQTWPVYLGADRLVLVSADYEMDAQSDEPPAAALVGHVFDRATRTWHDVRWEGLPSLDFPQGVVGPDGRLYVPVPATQGEIPEGGWPTGPDGEAEDADAEGDTYALWSVSLTDATDVRDEQVSVGDFVFDGDRLIWTDRTNGAPGLVHVRDLATGEEHAFDPHTGERCNLLSFGAGDGRIMMSQYCGTYDDGRDDRVQILTTDGDQVTTIQGDGVDGAVTSAGRSGHLVTVTSWDRGEGGTYVYDLDTDRFLRISDAVSNFGLGGPTPDGQLMWHTPANHRHGATQWVGELM
jgi:hypothetical protein